MILRWVRFLLIVSVILISYKGLRAQKQDEIERYKKFITYYELGDFVNAESCLQNSLEFKEAFTKEILIAIYNNLGVINNRLGKYEDALKYFDSAEALVDENVQYRLSLADIYINKARIYGIIKEPDKAVDYLEQGLKIYLSFNKPNKEILFRISAVYLNLGLTYFEKREYNFALQYLEISKNIKLKNNLAEVALTYLNMAKTYVEINSKGLAQRYFLKSIESFEREFGRDYYRISSVLFDYGLFLRSIGKTSEALEMHQKALAICLKNYGAKHTFVSLSYKHIGDHFFYLSDYQTALQYYQNSLIAVVSDFNNTDIYTNPSLGSVIFDIRLLENLKQKAKALALYSQQQSDPKSRQQLLVKSSETIGLALQLIGRIRSGYVSIESRIYLAENEKETYIFATHIAQQLYELTKDDEYLQNMYSITRLGKSAVLRNEITENELLYRKYNTDSLNDKQNILLVNIASLNKLIQDEFQKPKPDSIKIDLWKGALFELNQSKENTENRIKKLFPQYETLLHKTELVSLNEIQNHLGKDETLVEYFLSNYNSDGKRRLYIFTITSGNVDYHMTYLDSHFARSVESIKQGTVNANSVDVYKTYTDALYYMYDKLIKPVEGSIVGRKLIVVPDEEIAYLSFDAFIRQKPDSDQVNYEGLPYLIYDYTISYGYTSSLIFKRGIDKQKTWMVYAFSPDSGIQQKSLRNGYRNLQGTGKEIGSIFNWFDGKAYYGEKATEGNFKLLIKQPAIFHLAMHSRTDSSNSKYSYLIFSAQSDSIDDGKLFNYEISMSRIETPMVVLSACNTGTGNLYHGEGLMSLTRGFILAGASSVINTFWDVNDDASAKIMIDFYSQLSKGKEKDDALRTAKLNYLKSASPTYTNPYYWAAYEVMGDKSPVERGVRRIYFLGIGVLLLLGGILYFGVLKKLNKPEIPNNLTAGRQGH